MFLEVVLFNMNIYWLFVGSFDLIYVVLCYDVTMRTYLFKECPGKPFGFPRRSLKTLNIYAGS